MSAIAEALADEGKDAGSMAYGNAGPIALLYHSEARLTVVVEHTRVAHVVFQALPR